MSSGGGRSRRRAAVAWSGRCPLLHLLLEKNSFGYLTFSLLATHTSKWVWHLGFHCWRQSYIQTCISAIKKMRCMLHIS